MTLFDQHIIKSIDAKSRGQEPAADDFKWSEAEKALDLRAMAFDFENHGLDERFGQSQHERANTACSNCRTLVFDEEKMVVAGIQYHIGCGGTIQALPF